MAFKAALMISLFFIPIIIVNAGLATSLPVLFGLYILSGLGMAGIGMGIAHDAIHGAYSKSKKVNKYMGYTLNLVGASDIIWKYQHNVLHHSFTNIDEADHDIKTPFFLRFSPHAKKNALHRFQHWYTWIFYGVSTFFWVTVRDFTGIVKYRKMGLIKTNKQFINELMQIIFWKVLYFSYVLVIPMITADFPAYMVLLAFFSMHFITGLIISLVFQTAHVMPETDFPLPDEDGVIESDRLIHQMATTSNFSPRSRVFSWFIGGLNYQIEHHLFPHICHVHYRKISHIVQLTAEEYGVPYLTKKTFLAAVISHLKMLRDLGRMEVQPLPASNNASQKPMSEVSI